MRRFLITVPAFGALGSLTSGRGLGHDIQKPGAGCCFRSFCIVGPTPQTVGPQALPLGLKDRGPLLRRSHSLCSLPGSVTILQLSDLPFIILGARCQLSEYP